MTFYAWRGLWLVLAWWQVPDASRGWSGYHGKVEAMRIPFPVGFVLVLLLSAGSVVADSMSPFLSKAGDGFFTLLIVIVVWYMRPPRINNGP